jgi:hypothetical protein
MNVKRQIMKIRSQFFEPLDTETTTAVFNAFHYLWEKDRFGGSCPGILIPDTLVVHKDKQVLYFTSKSSIKRRKILKKRHKGKNKVYDKTTITKHFCKRQFQRRNYVDSTMNKTEHYFTSIKKKKTGRVVCKLMWEDSRKLKIRYLDKTQLIQFVNEQWASKEEGEDEKNEKYSARDSATINNKPNADGINSPANNFDKYILQRFVEPASQNNTIIKATWRQSECYINSCTNLNNFEDFEIDVNDRTATYDKENMTNSNLTTENIIKSKSLVNKIIACCTAMAKHIQKHSTKYLEVCQMIIYFKIAISGELYYLWTSDFKCSNIRASTRFLRSIMTSSRRRKTMRSVIPTNNEAYNSNNNVMSEPTLLELWGEDINDSWDDIDPIKKRKSKQRLSLYRSGNKPIRLDQVKENLSSNSPKPSKSKLSHIGFGISNNSDKNTNNVVSLENLLKEMKSKKEQSNKFHCPVEKCNRVEPLHVRRSEATIKDIVDFYRSGFTIHQNLHTWNIEEVAMLGVAPLFGPRIESKEEIPLVLAKYVPGKSKRRYDILCRDQTFMYRTIRVCSRCASLFLKRAKLALKNQVAANDIFKDQIKHRVTNAKIIRKYSGPVVPIKNKNIDRLATAKYTREKFSIISEEPKSNRKSCRNKKRPKSAGPARRRKQLDNPQFDVPNFEIPLELPKSLTGWEPTHEWKDILQNKLDAEEERENNRKLKHYSIYSKQNMDIHTPKDRRTTQHKRPQSAPMSRNRIAKATMKEASDKRKTMMEKQFKIYGVKSYSQLKRNGITTCARLRHVKQYNKSDTRNKKVCSAKKINNPSKKQKKQRPQSASRRRCDSKQKFKKKQRPSSATNKRKYICEIKAPETKQLPDKTKVTSDVGNSNNMNIIEQTYSYANHLKFITEAKLQTPPPRGTPKSELNWERDKYKNIISPVPLDLTSLSPSVGVKTNKLNMTPYVDESYEVFV